MASSMMVFSTTVTVARLTALIQSTMVAPYTCLKSIAALPAAFRAATNLNHLPSNGGRAQCMQAWPIDGVKKFEMLSYLPQLSPDALLKQIDYLIHSGWIPCLEFSKMDLCIGRIIGHMDTMMDGTRQCGSCLCSDAQIQLKC